MKNDELPQNQKPAGAPQPTAPVPSSQNEINFTPSTGEVAKRAYSAYINQGSQPGHEMQHWVEAEAQLIAERGLNRVQPIAEQNPARVHHFHHWDLK